MTKQEKKARTIATKLVNALAEFELFQDDAELILDEALQIQPKYQISEKQLAEIRSMVTAMKRELFISSVEASINNC